MSNKVITWLEKIGTDIKNDFAKAEPVAEIVVEDAGKAAEPFIAAYAPSLLPAVQATLTAIATAQAAGVNAAAGASNGVAKLASVVATVEPILTPLLAKDGITTSTAGVTTFVNSMVAALNAFPPAASTSKASVGTSPVPA